MVKVVIAVVLFAHAIGHVLGPLQVAKVATVNPTWAGDSWLLTGVTGQTLSNIVGLVLWVAGLTGHAAGGRRHYY